MLPCARIGDLTFGYCSSHGKPVFGTIITGEPTVLINYKPAATIGSTVLATCGHTAKIVTAKTDFQEGFFGLAARLGDVAVGRFYTATVITSSLDTFT